MLSKLIKGQKGQVLPIVLVLLVLGGLVIAPTLRYASTSLKGHEVLERKGDELYAADSGIDYALFKLSNGETTIDVPYQINGKTVSVNITDMGDGSYLITSTATTSGGESSTTIHTGVSSSADFTYFFDNAITSNGNVEIKGEVVGNVTAGGSITLSGGGDIVDPYEDDPYADLNWPSPENFSSYYITDVDTGDPQYTDGVIDLNGVSQNISSCYVNNDLDIYNSSNTAANLTLEGTLYITGDVLIGTSNHPFTLDLNGNTIFIESDSADPQRALWVGDKCTIIGSGCIIAVGDIYFAPDGDVGSESDFVFVMSVSGTTWLQPGGDYYGSIAGNADVYLKPGCYLEWNSLGGEGNLNFPYDVGVLNSSTTDMVLGGWDVS